MVFIRGETPRNPEAPDPGFYLFRWIKRGPLVPAEIIHRRGLWGVAIDGQPPAEWRADPWLVKHMERCWLGTRSDAAENARRLALKAIPGHPARSPHQPIDLANAPVLKLT